MIFVHRIVEYAWVFFPIYFTYCFSLPICYLKLSWYKSYRLYHSLRNELNFRKFYTVFYFITLVLLTRITETRDSNSEKKLTPTPLWFRSHDKVASDSSDPYTIWLQSNDEIWYLNSKVDERFSFYYSKTAPLAPKSFSNLDSWFHPAPES